ncbi:MAG: hypothetical protein EOP51_23175 [Sphingobacteriales bacterium]|nr:MAG: hypothetical protein EOP51_23175 [Sphingobacteriales bacterium]
MHSPVKYLPAGRVRIIGWRFSEGDQLLQKYFASLIFIVLQHYQFVTKLFPVAGFRALITINLLLLNMPYYTTDYFIAMHFSASVFFIVLRIKLIDSLTLA